MFCRTSGAALCSKRREITGLDNSASRCEHLNTKMLKNVEKNKVKTTRFPSRTHYEVTLPPPLKQRELPKNPYADYEAYYNYMNDAQT